MTIPPRSVVRLSVTLLLRAGSHEVLHHPVQALVGASELVHVNHPSRGERHAAKREIPASGPC
jgi:hypothetical protein